jgi:hypothetical protein
MGGAPVPSHLLAVLTDAAQNEVRSDDPTDEDPDRQ